MTISKLQKYEDSLFSSPYVTLKSPNETTVVGKRSSYPNNFSPKSVDRCYISSKIIKAYEREKESELEKVEKIQLLSFDNTRNKNNSITK